MDKQTEEKIKQFRKHVQERNYEIQLNYIKGQLKSSVEKLLKYETHKPKIEIDLHTYIKELLKKEEGN